MKRCILILPYFGKFKNYFQLFLNSIKTNPFVDLLIVTDQNMNEYNTSENVYIKNMNFCDFKTKVQKKFKFTISLESPYKLCDYKPSYGYIFEDEITNYEYWGHCDCDLIFGDLTPVCDLLNNRKFNKIFANGHLTLYFNSFENNRLFMAPLHNRYIFQEAFTTDKIYGFDEGYVNCNGELLSVHEIFMNKCPNDVYVNDLCFNPSTIFYNLRNVLYEETEKKWVIRDFMNVYIFDSKVIGVTKNNKKKEFIYCHLQGRNMKCSSYFSNFEIRPNKFVKVKKIHSFKKYFSFKCVELFLRRLLRRLRQRH